MGVCPFLFTFLYLGKSSGRAPTGASLFVKESVRLSMSQLQVRLFGPYFSSFLTHSYCYESANEPKSVLKHPDFRFAPYNLTISTRQQKVSKKCLYPGPPSLYELWRVNSGIPIYEVGLVLIDNYKLIRARAEPSLQLETGVKSLVISNDREKSVLVVWTKKTDLSRWSRWQWSNPPLAPFFQSGDNK